MGAPLSPDLRERILEAVDSGEKSYPLIAEHFSVSVTTVERLVRRRREGKPAEPGKSTGRPKKLAQHHLEWIAQEVESNPYLTSYELSDRFRKRFRNIKLHRSTMLRAMHEVGFSFKKNALRSTSRPS